MIKITDLIPKGVKALINANRKPRPPIQSQTIPEWYYMKESPLAKRTTTKNTTSNDQINYITHKLIDLYNLAKRFFVNLID